MTLVCIWCDPRPHFFLFQVSSPILQNSSLKITPNQWNQFSLKDAFFVFRMLKHNKSVIQYEDQLTFFTKSHYYFEIWATIAPILTLLHLLKGITKFFTSNKSLPGALRLHSTITSKLNELNLNQGVYHSRNPRIVLGYLEYLFHAVKI